MIAIMPIIAPNIEATNTPIEIMSFGALIIQMMAGINGSMHNALST
jgi:hypothetical protein